MSTQGTAGRSEAELPVEQRPNPPPRGDLQGYDLDRTDGDRADAGDGKWNFHEELRRRNLEILLWTNLIFNPTLILWGIFDYFLAPASWRYFLSLRLAGVAVNTTAI